jgi:hypothetical protein
MSEQKGSLGQVKAASVVFALLLALGGCVPQDSSELGAFVQDFLLSAAAALLL